MCSLDNPAQTAALQGLRLRFPRYPGESWLTVDGERICRFHLTSGSVTIMADGEIIGDLEAAAQPSPVRVIHAAPGEYSDSFEQAARDVRRAA